MKLRHHIERTNLAAVPLGGAAVWVNANHADGYIAVKRKKRATPCQAGRILCRIARVMLRQCQHERLGIAQNTIAAQAAPCAYILGRGFADGGPVSVRMARAFLGRCHIGASDVFQRHIQRLDAQPDRTVPREGQDDMAGWCIRLLKPDMEQ